MRAGMRRFFHLHLYQIPYHHTTRLDGRVMVCDRRDDAEEDEDVPDPWRLGYWYHIHT